MIRSDRFLISHKPYAVDLSTLKASQETNHGRHFLRGSVRAVWYRRQAGVTRACLGQLGLWAHYLPELVSDVADPMAVLSADLDGRYGGDCEGRWDGENYWGAQKPETIEQHLAVLRPMLANFPAIPDGYDGWWRF
jgi:hypothetical protein